MKKTNKIVYIGLLVAQALVLHIIERMIPVPIKGKIDDDIILSH